MSCMCMHVHICMCKCAYMCICECACVCVCLYNNYMCICVCVCVCVCVLLWGAWGKMKLGISHLSSWGLCKYKTPHISIHEACQAFLCGTNCSPKENFPVITHNTCVVCKLPVWLGRCNCKMTTTGSLLCVSMHVWMWYINFIGI